MHCQSKNGRGISFDEMVYQFYGPSQNSRLSVLRRTLARAKTPGGDNTTEDVQGMDDLGVKRPAVVSVVLCGIVRYVGFIARNS